MRIVLSISMNFMIGKVLLNVVAGGVHRNHRPLILLRPVVTLCTTRFEDQNSYLLPTRYIDLLMCDPQKGKAIISLYIIN